MGIGHFLLQGVGGVGRFWLCHGKIYLIPPKRNPIIHLIGPHLVVNFLESPSLYSVGNEWPPPPWECSAPPSPFDDRLWLLP